MYTHTPICQKGLFSKIFAFKSYRTTEYITHPFNSAIRLSDTLMYTHTHKKQIFPTYNYTTFSPVCQAKKLIYPLKSRLTQFHTFSSGALFLTIPPKPFFSILHGHNIYHYHSAYYTAPTETISKSRS